MNTNMKPREIAARLREQASGCPEAEPYQAARYPREKKHKDQEWATFYDRLADGTEAPRQTFLFGSLKLACPATRQAILRMAAKFDKPAASEKRYLMTDKMPGPARSMGRGINADAIHAALLAECGETVGAVDPRDDCMTCGGGCCDECHEAGAQGAGGAV